MTNVHYIRVMVFEFISVFFATYGLTLSIIIYESKDSPTFEKHESILLYYNAFCTFALVLSTFLKYKVYNAWFVSRGLHTEFDTLFSTGWWRPLSIEMLMLLVSPYPYLYNYKYTEYLDSYGLMIEYKLNDLLMCFGFVRIYILLRCLLVASKFMNPRSKRVCFMNNCEANLLFSLKAYMKQSPFISINIAITITILLFGYALKVFEGPVSEASHQDFNNLGNSMWCVIVTLATVGYGEFYPKTLLGRLAGLIICFWGTFLVSYFVVTVTNMLTFAPSEEKSYTLLQRLHFKEELKRYAVNVLSSAFRHKTTIAKNGGNEESAGVLSAKRHFRGNTL